MTTHIVCLGNGGYDGGVEQDEKSLWCEINGVFDGKMRKYCLQFLAAARFSVLLLAARSLIAHFEA